MNSLKRLIQQLRAPAKTAETAPQLEHPNFWMYP